MTKFGAGKAGLFYLAAAISVSTVAAPVLAGAASDTSGSGLSFKKSEPADKRAFEQARATEDAGDKLTALRKFIANYPDSHLVDRAQGEIFSVLTERLPQRVADVQRQARWLVEHYKGGLGGALTQADVANTLANAGVDLTDAEQWARTSALALTEPQFLRWTQQGNSSAKQDTDAVAESHRRFASYRSEVLVALANVYWREGKAGQARAALSEAAKLDPNGDEVNALLGVVALADHHDAQALEAFERAQVAGELAPLRREKMLELYRQAHHGSLDGFEQALDARYASMFPSPIKPTQKAAPPGNHTVLVELFTGAGCPPCVAADLALEAADEAYSRQQLVVLAFDQHIPRPDPLANPATVARGKWYGISGTPTFFVDGETATDIDGGGRARSPASYAQLTKLVDARLVQRSPLTLQVAAHLDGDGKVQVQTVVKAVQGSQLPAGQAPVVQVALVENHVRYSGENGIRFHEAVVRAMGGAAGVGIGPAVADKTLQASFDVSTIESQLHSYLDAYEQHNDRYGPIQFVAKNTRMDRSKLAIVAFLQDPASKTVLQAAFVPLETH